MYSIDETEKACMHIHTAVHTVLIDSKHLMQSTSEGQQCASTADTVVAAAVLAAAAAAAAVLVLAAVICML
jgi:hypothetical protein